MKNIPNDIYRQDEWTVQQMVFFMERARLRMVRHMSQFLQLLSHSTSNIMFIATVIRDELLSENHENSIEFTGLLVQDWS